MPLPIEVFNSLSPFGNGDGHSDFTRSADLPQGRDRASSLLESCDISLQNLVKLFAQSVALASFCAVDLPYGPVKNRVKTLLENQISFLADEHLLQADLVPALQRWRDQVVNSMGALSEEFTDWRGRRYISDQDVDRFNIQYAALIESLDGYVRLILDQAPHARDLESDDLIRICLQVIQTEHIRGKDWASAFFGLTEIKAARLGIASPALRPYGNPLPRTQIETLGGRRGRYILFTFHPKDFLVKQFVLLSFRFFHEYVSHVYAAIYPDRDEQGMLIDDRINAYRLIPVEFKEGWMIHTAETFFEENAVYLLGNHSHMREEVLRGIRGWVLGLVDPDDSTYVPRIDIGHNLAEKLLVFLLHECELGSASRARTLYYRLSFDLITRYPANGFDHTEFMTALGVSLSIQRNQLSQDVSTCLRVRDEVEYIDLDCLWSVLKSRGPTLDLPGFEGLKG